MKKASLSKVPPSNKKQRIINGCVQHIVSFYEGSHEESQGKTCPSPCFQSLPQWAHPRRGEDHLFQYPIVKVDPDCCTTIIEFNEQYVIDGGYQFHNYAITGDDEESDIPDYSLSHLEEDHNDV